MKLQRLSGDWYSLTPTADPEEAFGKLARELAQVPGVSTLKSDSGRTMSVEVHRSHLPLLPKKLADTFRKQDAKFQSKFQCEFRPKFELRPYQEEAIQFARSRKGSLFLHGLGLGKTVMALCACKSPSMAVVPTAAITVWEQEAAQMGMKTQVIRGTVADKALITSGADLFISTYQSVIHWAPFYKRLSIGPLIDTLILDEAHFLHKVGLGWFEVLFALGRRHTIAATGTPARNRLKSLYGVLTALQGTPRPWGGLWEFRKRYCGAFQTDYGWQDGEPTNQEELASRLTEVAISADWGDPSLEGLRPEIARASDALYLPRATRARISEEALKGSVRDGKQQTLVWLNAQRRSLGIEKLELLKQRYPAEQFDQDGHDRAIWWCWHKPLAQDLATHFRETADCPVDLVTGSTTPKARAKVLDEWKYGDPTEKRILVATMASMSAACNLVTAEAAYFVEYDWAPLNVAQAEKRHHRPGNRFGTVWAYYFYIQNTLETKMLDTLLSKLENQEQAIPSEDQREQFQQIMGRSEALDYEDILNSVALELMEEEE